MLFCDVRADGGKLATTIRHETGEIAPVALETCAHMLDELRRGQLTTRPPFGIEPGEPDDFDVTLGPPEWLHEQMGEAVEAAGRFFCIAAPGRPPFSINLVLPDDPLTESDRYACGTLLALSLYRTPAAEREAIQDALEATIEAMLDLRPLLATALIPTPGITPGLIAMASDFAACFAATMLLDETSRKDKDPS